MSLPSIILGDGVLGLVPSMSIALTSTKTLFRCFPFLFKQGRACRFCFSDQRLKVRCDYCGRAQQGSEAQETAAYSLVFHSMALPITFWATLRKVLPVLILVEIQIPRRAFSSPSLCYYKIKRLR